MGWGKLFGTIASPLTGLGTAVGDLYDSSDFLQKTAKSGLDALGNPFSSDKRKRGKFYANLLTGGASGATEFVAEEVGKPLGKMAAKELGRGIGNFSQDFNAGLSLAMDPGGTLGLAADSPGSQAATREIYDPRRRNKGGSRFGALTDGQYSSQPSLIG